MSGGLSADTACTSHVDRSHGHVGPPRKLDNVGGDAQTPTDMAVLQSALTRFVLDPAHHDVLSIVKGARNGLVYGAKIRFPHALVMVTLFGSGSVQQRWKKIITATRQHAVRLAKYVAIYKTSLMILRDLFHEGKQHSVDPFIAGMLGGWYMFGDRTPVNEQVCVQHLRRLSCTVSHDALRRSCHAPRCQKTTRRTGCCPSTIRPTSCLLR